MYKLHWLYRRICVLLAPLLAVPFIAIAWSSHRLHGEISQASLLISRIPFFLGERMRWIYYRALLLSVGDEVTIKYGAFFQYRNARIGSRVLIGYFNTMGEVDIGDDVLLGGHINVLSGLSQHSFEDTSKPIREASAPGRRMIRIGSDVWVGSNAVIGNDIGDRCVVAAGSVVVKPVESHTLVGGNPAKVIRTI